MEASEKGGSAVNAICTSCPSVASVMGLPSLSCSAKVTVGSSMGTTTGASSLIVPVRAMESVALVMVSSTMWLGSTTTRVRVTVKSSSCSVSESVRVATLRVAVVCPGRNERAPIASAV